MKEGWRFQQMMMMEQTDIYIYLEKEYQAKCHILYNK